MWPAEPWFGTWREQWPLIYPPPPCQIPKPIGLHGQSEPGCNLLLPPAGLGWSWAMLTCPPVLTRLGYASFPMWDWAMSPPPGYGSGLSHTSPLPTVELVWSWAKPLLLPSGTGLGLGHVPFPCGAWICPLPPSPPSCVARPRPLPRGQAVSIHAARWYLLHLPQAQDQDQQPMDGLGTAHLAHQGFKLNSLTSAKLSMYIIFLSAYLSWDLNSCTAKTTKWIKVVLNVQNNQMSVVM